MSKSYDSERFSVIFNGELIKNLKEVWCLYNVDSYLILCVGDKRTCMDTCDLVVSNMIQFGVFGLVKPFLKVIKLPSRQQELDKMFQDKRYFIEVVSKLK